MKRVYALVAALCLFAFYASAKTASAQTIASKGGVTVTVQYDPSGPNNQIAAYIRFTNNNGYKVNVNWTPVFTCEDGEAIKGYGSGFSVNGGESYQVNIWRSGACGLRKIKYTEVEMDVKAGGM